MPICCCMRHMRAQTPGSSLIDRISGAWVRITAPVPRIAAHRGAQLLRLHLPRVGEVRHERERLARLDDLLEQPQRVVGVRVGEEPGRPVRERLGADADRLDLLELEQRLDVAAQHRLTHDHRVAAGEQHAGDLRVLLQVRDEPGDVVGGHLQVRLADELGPAEAVRAVRVTGLALFGEEEHGLRVLVLQAVDRLVADPRHVELELARRVRVEPHAHLVGGRLHLGRGRAVAQQPRDAGTRPPRGACPPAGRRAGRSGRPARRTSR